MDKKKKFKINFKLKPDMTYAELKALRDGLNSFFEKDIEKMNYKNKGICKFYSELNFYPNVSVNVKKRPEKEITFILK